MLPRLAKISSRSGIVLMEIMAALAFLLVLLVGIIVWRVTSGPMDVGFAKPYIEDALNSTDTGYHVALGKVVLDWPDLSAPVSLELQKVDLSKDGRTVLSVNNINLVLQRRSLFIGQIRPKQIVLDKPALHLVRSADNEFSLYLEGEKTADNAPETQPEKDAASSGANPLMDMVDMLAEPDSALNQDSVLRALNAIQINNARAVVEDHALGVTWFLPDIDMSFARDSAGLMMQASLPLPGGGGVNGATNIQADVIYDRATRQFDAHLNVQDFNPHFLTQKIPQLDFLKDQFIVLNGNVRVTLDENLTMTKADIVVAADHPSLKLDGVYKDRLSMQNISLDASYDAADKLLDVKALDLQAHDVAINIAAKTRFGDDKIASALTLNIPSLKMDQVPSIWPQPLLAGEPAEKWLMQRLSKGELLDTKVKLDLTSTKKDGAWHVSDPENLTADMKIENMTVDYRAPLRPVTNAYGTGHMENDVMTYHIEKGDLGDLKITDSKAVIDHVLEKGVGNANIYINLAGPVTSVFKYIGDEPINKKAADMGLDMDGLAGTADLAVHVKFPTIKDVPVEDVKVTAKGTLSDVRLPHVVHGLDITGGPLSLDLGEGKVSLAGKALLDGRPVAMSWEEYLHHDDKDTPYITRITAQIMADKRLRDHFGVNLDDWIQGTFPLDVTFTEYKDGRAEAAVKGDITPAILTVSAMDYAKPAGVKGSFSATALTAGKALREIKDLTVTTPQLDLQGGRLIFAPVKGKDELKRGHIKTAKLGDTDITLDFEMSKGDVLKLDVKGPFLDARPFLDKKQDKTGQQKKPQAVVASVAVDRMRTKENRLIEKAKLYVDVNAQGQLDQLEMDALAGKGDIYLRFKPDRNGIQRIRLEAADAGATLRAFGVYDNIEGGKLVIDGAAKSRNTPRELDGKIELSDFTVVDAPVLARILGAMGPTSFAQLLGGEGIYFSRLESDFGWGLRKQGDIYVLKNGRTSGSSLGLTFEGSVDKAKDYIDLKGTVVPVSELNSMVGNIPVIGDILAGGKGGALIAATYKVKGPADKPEVSVNPLAALAPGFLRKLLFEE